MPLERIVCLTEEPTEILYLLGEGRRVVGISKWTVRPPEAREEKPIVSAFTGGNVKRICELEPDLVIGFSDIQAELASKLIAANQQVLIFNQRSIAEILDVILVLGRMVGREIHDAFYPERYYCHDAEDPDGMMSLGTTRHGEEVRVNRRACESDLVIYININLVPMDGGHKSVTVGLCDYKSLTYHHEPQTIIDSDGYMDPSRSELNHKCVRMGGLVDDNMNVFHIETVLNNRMYSEQLEFLGKNEDDFTDFDRMKLAATKWTTSKMPRSVKRISSSYRSDAKRTSSGPISGHVLRNFPFSCQNSAIGVPASSS